MKKILETKRKIVVTVEGESRLCEVDRSIFMAITESSFNATNENMTEQEREHKRDVLIHLCLEAFENTRHKYNVPVYSFTRSEE